MEIVRSGDRAAPQERMEGALREVIILRTAAGGGPSSGAPAPGASGEKTPEAPAGVGDRWELVLVDAREGTSVLPVPFPTDEVGLILEGTVELIRLPPDYDPDLPLTEQAPAAVLGPGDAFGIARGDRVWIDVLTDLTFVVWRRTVELPTGGPPPGLCV